MDKELQDQNRAIYEIRKAKHFRTDEFRTEAMQFREKGYYCKYPPDSIQGRRYWDEQSRRCIFGYNAGHDAITGYHYFYLNFSPILKVEFDKGALADTAGRIKGDRVEGFPAFWDGDYNFFWYCDEAEWTGNHADVSKRRGSGYSFKGSSMLNRNYFFFPDSKNYAVAFEKEYLLKDGILTKAWNIMDFVDQNTPWIKHRHGKDSQMHRIAKREVKIGTGIKTKKGIGSEIMGISLKDDPDKIRGKRGKLIIFEEKGKFPGLLKAWSISQFSMAQDNVVFGLMLAIGTSGEEGADFVAFEKFFKKPRVYQILPVKNEWEKNGKDCSFFLPGYMNVQGKMDDDGNSDIPAARKQIEDHVAFLERESDDLNEITKYKAEMPIEPKDMFVRVGDTAFPIDSLSSYLGEMEVNERKYRNAEYIGDIEIDPDTNKWKWVKNSKLYPIREYPLIEEKHKPGCIVIYQMPVKDDSGKTPHGVYIGGIDSYDHDESNTSSLGSLFVMNKLTGEIVAEYTGRPRLASMFYENCRRLLHLFNATANYENYNKGILTYFENHNCDYLLAETPKILSDVIKDSKVNRKKGTHPTETVKQYCRSLINKWLLSAHPSKDGRLMMHTIPSKPLLEEMIYWTKDGNYDRVDAFGYLMLLKEERFKHNPQIDKKVRTASDDILDMFNNYLKNT